MHLDTHIHVHTGVQACLISTHEDKRIRGPHTHTAELGVTGDWGWAQGGLRLKWPDRTSINPSQGGQGPGRVGDSGRPGSPTSQLGFPALPPSFLRKRGEKGREGPGDVVSSSHMLTIPYIPWCECAGVSRSQSASLGHRSALISSCSLGLPDRDRDPLAARPSPCLPSVFSVLLGHPSQPSFPSLPSCFHLSPLSSLD